MGLESAHLVGDWPGLAYFLALEERAVALLAFIPIYALTGLPR